MRTNIHQTRTVESLRLGLTVVSLLLGITIIGTTADVLAVFERSHISDDYLLPLWPTDFNLGPTIAITVGGAIVTLCSALAITASKISIISNRAILPTALALLAPTASLLAAIIGTAFFYAVNASRRIDTLQSWSCRWQHVTMQREPHFGQLCSLSRAGLYAELILIPLQVIVLGLAAIGVVLRRRAARLRGEVRGDVVLEGRKGSPAFSEGG